MIVVFYLAYCLSIICRHCVCVFSFLSGNTVGGFKVEFRFNRVWYTLPGQMPMAEKFVLIFKIAEYNADTMSVMTRNKGR